MDGNCTVHRILFYLQGCIDDQELAGVMLGVFSAALWTLVHMSFYTQRRKNRKMNRHVTSSITMHMMADGLSCMGAILSQQKSLQVIFALFGTVVNAAIGLHCWCSKTSENITVDEDRNVTMRRTGSDKYHCLCSTLFLTLCLMFITMCVTEYLTISDDHVIYENSKLLQPHMHTVLIVGYIMASVGTLSYWMSKFYEVVESYRNSRSKGIHTCMYLTAITGDTTYLLGVYIQMSTVVYIIQTLPWTIARMGLLGIHIGIIFQRRCFTQQRTENDKITLLNRVGKSDSDWSDDSSTVICTTCDLQTSVKQMICSESPEFQEEAVKSGSHLHPHSFNKELPNTMESASSESPELEWDFEWLSDTKRRQFTKLDIHKLSPYDGYFKVVEWFRKSCDNECLSDTDDFIGNSNLKDALDILHSESQVSK